jgi:hypothetical protein
MFELTLQEDQHHQLDLEHLMYLDYLFTKDRLFMYFFKYIIYLDDQQNQLDLDNLFVRGNLLNLVFPEHL